MHVHYVLRASAATFTGNIFLWLQHRRRCYQESLSLLESNEMHNHSSYMSMTGTQYGYRQTYSRLVHTARTLVPLDLIPPPCHLRPSRLPLESSPRLDLALAR